MSNLRQVNAFQRLVALAGAAVLLTSAMPGAASAAAKSAAMVVDANTGRVLYAQSADAKRYPASLTKMMTLFMVFDEMRAGRLTLSSRITMSKTAAQRPPSKLGLKPGQSLTVKQAIQVLVTKSANDVAAAIGEHIAGSEWKFALKMTERARQLGMTSTTFRNASGLPDAQQMTTARDMLTLALALQDLYPEHFHFFSTRAASVAGKTYRSHNTLLRSMRGVDGIKTGYTRASGFNVATSMRHDGRHIVAVVFGGKTAGRRNARMRSLLYQALKKASRQKTRRTPPQLIARPKTAPRPQTAAARPAPPPIRKPEAVPKPNPRYAVEVASLDKTAATSTTPNPAATRQPMRIARVKPVSVFAPLPPPASPPPWAAAAKPTVPESRARQPSTLNAQAASLSGRQYAAAEPSQPKPAYNLNGPRPYEAPTPAVRQGAYQIQVGSFATSQEAERHVRQLQQGQSGALRGYAPLTMPAIVNGRQYWRVRFAGFDATAASRTCNELRRSSIDCFVAKGR